MAGLLDPKLGMLAFKVGLVVIILTTILASGFDLLQGNPVEQFSPLLLMVTAISALLVGLVNISKGEGQKVLLGLVALALIATPALSFFGAIAVPFVTPLLTNIVAYFIGIGLVVVLSVMYKWFERK